MAEQPPRILTRKRALMCLGMNALAFPGLGTIMAGRAMGYVQAALMLVGFFMSTGYIAWYLLSSVSALNRFMLNGVQEDLSQQFKPWLWVLWLGLAISGLAWLWSMVSSLMLLREVPESKGPPRIQ
jgi:hypothetical protein